jgi:hypothetical protein
MHGPPLVAWLLVALSAAASATCLLRRDAGDEALTGAGMAVMAVPMSVFDPRPWAAPVFAAVFAVATVHAVVRRCVHRAHHAVCSAAMVYMAVSMTGAGAADGGHLGHGGTGGSPLLTGLLLVYFAGYVLRSGLRLAAAPAHGGPVPAAAGQVRLRHAPEVAAACRVSMALGMFAMLLIL